MKMKELGGANLTHMKQFQPRSALAVSLLPPPARTKHEQAQLSSFIFVFQARVNTFNLLAAEIALLKWWQAFFFFLMYIVRV